MKRYYTILFIAILCLLTPHMEGQAKSLPDSCRHKISALLTRIVDREVAGGTARINSYSVKGRRLRLNASIGLSNYPFREESVQAIYDSIRLELPKEWQKYSLELYTDAHLIEELIPLAERTRFDRRKVIPFINPTSHPLVSPEAPLCRAKDGLYGRHIALWQSHGRYFEQETNRWQWQRTVHWQTREDLFTQSFVLPFLVPMLERAGAYVMLPRERDTQTEELLLDHDHDKATYRETGEGWREIESGFAFRGGVLRGEENPFMAGTARMIRTTNRPDEVSHAVWRADIPKTGEYALYVSYRSTPQSASDARYTVRYKGGERHFRVNQQMGGSTWIYIGTFPFVEGEGQEVISLSNYSDKSGQIVVADAVRLGGGMGNVARTVCDSLRHEGVSYHEQLSGLPRYMEGARYWLQWAGFPKEVYAPKGGTDDYKEDYMARAHWVNALMGGSERLPDTEGLAIPIDLALAFHSDSGVRDSDETIGTLGIFYTAENKGRFEGGASRYRSRDLTDLVMTEITEAIRSEMEPTWRRRGLWNRSYFEARVPAAPTMLLELLSHQNFADMRLGHDPRFKFLVSRAIYKGILKHVAAQYGYSYVVQPLPIKAFRIERTGERMHTLRWSPREDPHEESAQPDYYLLYTAIDNEGFDGGRRVEATEVELELQPDHLYRFRVVACNRGGESFPSETLAAAVSSEEQGEVLVVNSFTRLSAPASFRTEDQAGFCQDDLGVSYLREISYTGMQYGYERRNINESNPSMALGASHEDCEGIILQGNSFDYVGLHGEAILAAGYSFSSSSKEAFLNEGAGEYRLLDLILGLERSSLLGRGLKGWEFRCFEGAMQERLRDYLKQGRGLLLSGAYIASDLWESEASSDADRRFAREVLHYEYHTGAAAQQGRLRPIAGELPTGALHFNQSGEEEIYRVIAPDALRPVGEGAFAALSYTENARTAAVAYQGAECRTLCMGLPFETITDRRERLRAMQAILQFLHQ